MSIKPLSPVSVASLAAIFDTPAALARFLGVDIRTGQFLFAGRPLTRRQRLMVEAYARGRIRSRKQAIERMHARLDREEASRTSALYRAVAELSSGE